MVLYEDYSAANAPYEWKADKHRKGGLIWNSSEKMAQLFQPKSLWTHEYDTYHRQGSLNQAGAQVKYWLQVKESQRRLLQYPGSILSGSFPKVQFWIYRQHRCYHPRLWSPQPGGKTHPHLSLGFQIGGGIVAEDLDPVIPGIGDDDLIPGIAPDPQDGRIAPGNPSPQCQRQGMENQKYNEDHGNQRESADCPWQQFFWAYSKLVEPHKSKQLMHPVEKHLQSWLCVLSKYVD